MFYIYEVSKTRIFFKWRPRFLSNDFSTMCLKIVSEQMQYTLNV